MVRPSTRRAMTEESVIQSGVSIRVAYIALVISETCYRYQSIVTDQNVEIADWLIRLTCMTGYRRAFRLFNFTMTLKSRLGN